MTTRKTYSDEQLLDRAMQELEFVNMTRDIHKLPPISRQPWLEERFQILRAKYPRQHRGSLS